jgi:hypothetical protein
MYLRTTKRRNADGTEVRYYQLAENVWDPERGCAVAKVVHSFGRADQLDGEKLKRLARSILRIFSDDASLLGEAEDVTIRDSWSYGGAWVLQQLWKELEIGKVVKVHAKSARTGEALERVEVGLPFPQTETGFGVEVEAEDAYSPFAPLTHPGTFLLLAALVGYVVYRIRGYYRAWEERAEPEGVWSGLVGNAIPASIAIVAFLIMSKLMDNSGPTTCSPWG